jgi:phenylalanyl-tRNA synthetase beta chain
LDESVLVIADARKPVAIAGIMGGRDTGVTSSTKRILVEAAQFDLGLIRRTSRKLGLTSDSCYRFERGISWRLTESASNRITDLVLQMAEGSIKARRDVVVSEPKRQRAEITVTAGDIQKLLGCTLDMGRCEKILKRLGCVVAAGQGSLSVVSPYFRNDIQIKEDVIEEVGRVIGYDNLPMSLPHVSAVNIVVDQEKEKFYERVSDLMIASGFNEVVLYSLVGRTALEKTGYQGPVIKLQNPMSAEQELMRPTSLASMLGVVASNMNRGQRDLKLFEVGKKYLPGGERWTLSIIMAGRRDDDWRHSKKEIVEFVDLKGVVEEVCAKVRVRGVTFAPGAVSFLEEGQHAAVFVNGKEIGCMGKIRSSVLTGFEIKKAHVYFAEIELEPLKEAVAARERFLELNEFPSAVRDISLAVKNGSASFEAMRALCMENGNGLLQRIDFVELYCGEKIAEGSRGYVLSFVYQAKGRTLTDGEVNTLHEDLTQKLVETFAVVRR